MESEANHRGKNRFLLLQTLDLRSSWDGKGRASLMGEEQEKATAFSARTERAFHFGDRSRRRLDLPTMNPADASRVRAVLVVPGAGFGFRGG